MVGNIFARTAALLMEKAIKVLHVCSIGGRLSILLEEDLSSQTATSALFFCVLPGQRRERLQMRVACIIKNAMYATVISLAYAYE